MLKAGPRTTVVVDATVVINLANAGRLDLLGSLAGWDFVVPDEVVEEIKRPHQKAALEGALQAGHLRRESSTEPAEMTLCAELRDCMGKGEAACLAMAATREWMVTSDDRGRAFRRIVQERIGKNRLCDTPWIVNEARAKGVVSDEESQRILESMRR